MVAFSKPMKPIPNNEAPPLIQKMDQDVLKAMLAHKVKTINCFLSHHPNAMSCCDGECEHEKIGTVSRKITLTENEVSLKDVDSMNVCVYIMPILGHLIDHELFSTFIQQEDTSITEVSE